MAKIKDRQYNFFKKLSDIPRGDAVVKEMIDICNESTMTRYYLNLQGNNCSHDTSDREKRIHESTSSMCTYYCEFNFQQMSDIYSSFLNDYYRFIITRWRLSNHDLRIETGRYTKPMTPRENRTCVLCNVIEDEYHVIFSCPLYNSIRMDCPNLVECNSISKFLDPTYNNMKETALFIHEVEKTRNKNA